MRINSKSFLLYYLQPICNILIVLMFVIPLKYRRLNVRRVLTTRDNINTQNIILFIHIVKLVCYIIKVTLILQFMIKFTSSIIKVIQTFKNISNNSILYNKTFNILSVLFILIIIIYNILTVILTSLFINKCNKYT